MQQPVPLSLAATQFQLGFQQKRLFNNIECACFEHLQITFLPEYYLSAAEASILAECGGSIVASCVQDGPVLLELGAG